MTVVDKAAGRGHWLGGHMSDADSLRGAGFEGSVELNGFPSPPTTKPTQPTSASWAGRPGFGIRQANVHLHAHAPG